MGLYQGSFTELDADVRAADVAIRDSAGNQLSGFDSTRPANAALTSVAGSATSVTILAANAARRKFYVHNDSAKNLKLAFAATASATAFTILLGAGAAYESPLNGYTGIVTGIWTSAAGFARVTEVTT